MSEMGGAGPENGAPLESLHPLTLLFNAVHVVRTLIVPTVLLVVVTWSPSAFIPVLIAGGIQMAVLAIRYASLRYGIQGEFLRIQEGVFSRRSRTIPLRTIQNIYLQRNPLHRLLGMVELRVETAGGGDAEASLSVISIAVGERLRDELLARSERGILVPDQVDKQLVLHRSTLLELLLMGATANRAGGIAIVLFWILDAFDEFRDKAVSIFEAQVTEIFGPVEESPGLYLLAGIIAVFLLGWVVSIGLTLIRYFRFTLQRTPDAKGLHRRQGFFTQFEGVLPLERIQVLRIDANFPRRLLGRCTVAAESAGSAKEKEAAGSTTLCPLLRSAELSSFCGQVMDGLTIDEEAFESVHPYALRRGFVRYFLLWLLLCAGFALFYDARVLYGIPLVLLLCAWLARIRYRVLGYQFLRGHLLSRAGVWNRKIWAVPLRRIQTLGISQSLIQRVLGIATLSIDTAGALRFQRARIIDLPVKDARSYFEALAVRAAEGASHDGI